MRADYQAQIKNPEGIVTNHDNWKIEQNIVLLVDEIIEKRNLE